MPIYATASTKNEVEPYNAGLKTWTGDPAVYTNNSLITTAGVLNIVLLYNQSTAPMSISSARVFVNTAGVTLANVGFALYSSAGAFLTSSVNTLGATATAFQSTGEKVITFTAQTIAARSSFYVGFWVTGTTMPQLQRAGGVAGMNNIGLAAPNFRFATTSNTGLTTTAPASLGTQTALNIAWWVGAA